VSLKWRIASGYAALLIAVMVVTGATIVWKLHSILYDQAKSSVDATMQSIVLSTQQANPFSLEEATAGTQFLFESGNLVVAEHLRAGRFVG